MKSDEIGSSIDTISKEAIENSAASLIPAGSVLIVVRSGILARTIPTALTTRELAVNQDIKALCPIKIVGNRYLHYYMRSAEKEILQLVTRSATVHRLSTDNLKTFPVPVPPLSEQKRIVAILDEAFEGIDTAVANAEKNLANASELFDSYLNSVFIQKGNDWATEQLGRVTRFIDYRGKTPPKRDTGVRLITAKNVKMGYIQRTPEEFVDPSAYDGWMTRGFPQKSDVLFTTEAPLGNVAQLDTDETVMIGQRLITLQPDGEFLDRTFLKFALMSAPIQQDIYDRGTGATVRGIKASLFKQVLMHFPRELSEQRLIAGRIGEMSEVCQRLEAIYQQRLDALAELKQSILHKAFTGNLTAHLEQTLEDAAE